MRIQRIAQTEENKAPAEDLSALDAIIAKYKGKKGSLIPLLQGAQDEMGFISQQAFHYLSDGSCYPVSELYGVATFYAQFRLKKAGENIIKVCHGTACHVQNASALTDALKEELNVEDGETTEDGVFTLEAVACLGCCSLAPVMMIGDETYAKLDGKKAAKVIKDIRKQAK
jgi:NADH-quinone oxidoreductase subunit E